MKSIEQVRKFVSRQRIDRPGIWQINLRNGRALCELARDRGLSYWCLDHDIDRLWRIGLLKADSILSPRKLRLKDLELIGNSIYQEHIYADVRELKRRKRGFGGVFSRMRPIPAYWSLNYHPFRYYVLLAAERYVKFSILSTNPFYDSSKSISLKDRTSKWFRQSTSTPGFAERFERLNHVVDLAISCEPVAYSKVFGFHKEPQFNPDFTERAGDAYAKELEVYSNEHSELLKSVGLEKIRDSHLELCREAQIFDPNLDLQRIVRLTERDIRIEKFKGTIGGAMYLLTMAELIRRATESVFGIELPEEDECGIYDVSAKELRYGSKRLLDDPRAQKNFLRQFRLDREVRVRWYVEGQTEFGAIQSISSNDPLVEIINLKGQVVAGSGKGLAFRENLEIDQKNSVYSWISLDGDNEDYLRTLKAAVDDKKMFGQFYISYPDFEFGNFTGLELAEVISLRARELETNLPAEKLLREMVTTVENNSEFFRVVKRAFPNRSDLKKDERWGHFLMQYALKNPKRSDTGKERDLVRSVREARFAVATSYFHSQMKSYVDRETGRIVQIK